MFEILKTVLILLLLIYSIALSIILWFEKKNIDNYQKEKEKILTEKEKELNHRESIVVDKEICFRELSKLKTIQSTAINLLQSYVIGQSNNHKETTTYDKSDIDNNNIITK